MYRHCRPISGFMLATTLVLASAAVAHAQTTLRWKFNKGDQFDQTIEQLMKMTMNLNDQVIVTSVNQTIDVDWNIQEVAADGNAKVEQAFRRIRMKVEAPGGAALEIDSDNPDAVDGPLAALAPTIKALAKAKFLVTMNSRGDIVDVEVSQEAVDALQNLPGAGQLGGLLSKEGLTKLVKQGSQKLPEGEVTKGKSWQNEAEVDLPQVGKMTATTTMTYDGPETVDGVELERVLLAVDTKITGGDNALLTIKDEGGKGTMHFNVKEGFLQRSSLQQNMVMQMNVGGNPVDQKIEQTINVSMKRGESP